MRHVTWLVIRGVQVAVIGSAGHSANQISQTEMKEGEKFHLGRSNGLQLVTGYIQSRYRIIGYYSISIVFQTVAKAIGGELF